MDRELVAILGFVCLFIMMLIRVPVGIAMGVVGVGGFAALKGWGPGLNLLINSPLRTVTDYSLSVVPLFVLMGIFASASGMSRELFNVTRTWFGHRRGGLAISTILACGGFAAINGSSIATAATMTKVALPEMRKAGYDPGTAAGTIAAGGTLGIIIPPSVAMLIFAILTEQDVARLFIAGILPGILAIILYIVTVRIMASRNPERFPTTERQGYRARLDALKEIWATLLLFLIVITSIYGGFVTVTEAAGVGATGALLIGIARRRLNWPTIQACLVDALRTSASIFIVAVGAFLFSYFLAITRTTQVLTAFLVDLPIGPYGVLALLMVVYLLLGALMDELAIIILTIPIVFPAMMELGFDPTWFGVIMVMTITIGLISPPVGMNVFVINSMARDIGLVRIFKGVLPFMTADILRLIILCAFPWISLVLPNSMP
jgi:tripartite ATP-independent transporter DctM subunit